VLIDRPALADVISGEMAPVALTITTTTATTTGTRPAR
jgi:hypothetical protein